MPSDPFPSSRTDRPELSGAGQDRPVERSRPRRPGIADHALARHVWPYFNGILMVAIATSISYLFERTVAPSSLSLVFLTAVLISALQYGLWPSILVSVLSMLAWNYFFLPPRFSFEIEDPQDLLALMLFLIVSLVVSQLAAFKLRQRESIAAQAEMTGQLYDFSQTIAAAESLDDLFSAAAHTIGAMLDCDVMILLARNGSLELQAMHPAVQTVEAETIAVAQAHWLGNGWRGRGMEASAEGGAFLPLRTRKGVIGAVGITRASDRSPPPNDHRLLSILVDQTAAAVERMQLAQTIDLARLEAETERLRNAMLTSLSHDLRTPLTTIIGAQSTLRSLGEACPPRIRNELLERSQAEAERLNRLIGNLLDMTRLESGKLNIRLEPIDVADVIQSAAERARPVTAEHRMSISLPPELPMVQADFLLLEQVVFNIVDNAAKYALPGTVIEIAARVPDGSVIIQIADQGPGIPANALESIFDKFGRVEHEDRQRPGTGLGLAICRGFLKAMGGTITASNREDCRGAVFTVRLTQAQFVPEPSELEADEARC